MSLPYSFRKKGIKASEALFAYVTESDQKKVKSVSSNYLKFARAKRKELSDYVDHKFITSVAHARKLLLEIENNKRKGTGEVLFKTNEEFDAWNYISSLIRNAQRRIVLIDGYIDERILSIFTKRDTNVTATIYSRYNQTIRTDIEKFNKQYPPIKYIQFSKAIHDRFLIIDDVVYHMGASLKDMGKSLCVVTKMEETPQNIIDIITK